jgi:hypothetical protein
MFREVKTSYLTVSDKVVIEGNLDVIIKDLMTYFNSCTFNNIKLLN